MLETVLRYSDAVQDGARRQGASCDRVVVVGGEHEFGESMTVHCMAGGSDSVWLCTVRALRSGRFRPSFGK